MNRHKPTPSSDRFAMFRDPGDGETSAAGETSLDDAFEFESETVDAKPVSPAEQEEQLRAQLSPEVGRPICGARNRKGMPCQCKKLYKGGRCKFHGGLSTGPKTREGKARVALNLPNARRPQPT